MSGQMGALVDGVATALVAAGLVESAASWTAERIPLTGGLEFVVRVEAGEGGVMDGTGIQQDAHRLVVDCLVGGGAETPRARMAAALDRVSLVRRTLDVASPGAGTWSHALYAGYEVGDIDAAWLRVSVAFVLRATFNYATAT